MSSKVQKWGNSLAVRIPKIVAEKAKLIEDSEVEVEAKNGVIVILPVRKSYSLSHLISEINSENLHEVEDVAPEGREVW